MRYSSLRKLCNRFPNPFMRNMNQLKSLPLGTASFERLRLTNQLYVDKTDLIFRLASKSEKFFLTRPRRFGKSLLLSTFASLFRNGIQHFSGLAIESAWKDTTYTVVTIDLSSVKNFTCLEDFNYKLASTLAESFGTAGFQVNQESPLRLISQISAWLNAQPISSLVLLIDEYDAPLTACLGNRALFDAVRLHLADFFSVIKTNDACLRFVFMTGITKFNQTGIFSELNNFTDISLFPEFGSLLGYTDSDIKTYFSDYIRSAAEKLHMSESCVYSQLQKNYDGFCFEESASVHVYAPWSVLNFLSWPSPEFKNYWIASGGMITLLSRYLDSHSLKAPEEYGKEQQIPLSYLSASADFDGINDKVLLTQTGYLTIKARNNDTFFVGYPNKEVADSMAKLYEGILLKNKTLTQVGAGNLTCAAQNGNIADFFKTVNRAFDAIDYANYPIREEKHCQAYLQIFLAGAGLDVVAEKHNVLGRSDLEFIVGDLHWVLELKFLKSKGPSDRELLEEALEQLRKRRYGLTGKERTLRVAAVFSEASRTFVLWQQA